MCISENMNIFLFTVFLYLIMRNLVFCGKVILLRHAGHSLNTTWNHCLLRLMKMPVTKHRCLHWYQGNCLVEPLQIKVQIKATWIWQHSIEKTLCYCGKPWWLYCGWMHLNTKRTDEMHQTGMQTYHEPKNVYEGSTLSGSVLEY